MIVARRLWARIALAVLVLGVACTVISPIRSRILRAIGWALVVNDPVERSDVIVVTIEADGAGTLEAADLVRNGIATRVGVFSEPPDAVEREFIRRGIPYENQATRSIRRLRALGVETVDLIPTYVGGSEDEGPVLADWCERHGFHSVVVVCTADHSRRLRRVLHRSMKGQMRATTCASPYSVFDPERWWQSHRGIRTEVAELQKLLVDFVLHPIS